MLYIFYPLIRLLLWSQNLDLRSFWRKHVISVFVYICSTQRDFFFEPPSGFFSNIPGTCYWKRLSLSPFAIKENSEHSEGSSLLFCLLHHNVPLYTICICIMYSNVLRTFVCNVVLYGWPWLCKAAESRDHTLVP